MKTLAAAFKQPSDAASIVQKLKASGVHKIEAYGPYPDEALLGLTSPARRSRLPLFALIGGLLGGCTGFGLQYWTAVVQYPLNIGGRPLNSWPAFMPITFELTVLFAASAIIMGFLCNTGLPRPHHPVFDIEGFERASDDRFFVVVHLNDEMARAASFQETFHEFFIQEAR